MQQDAGRLPRDLLVLVDPISIGPIDYAGNPTGNQQHTGNHRHPDPLSLCLCVCAARLTVSCLHAV